MSGTHLNFKMLGTAGYRLPRKLQKLGTAEFRVSARKKFLGTHGYRVTTKVQFMPTADPHTHREFAFEKKL